MRVKDALGRWGEQLAADQLTAAGLTILDRNWRCTAGELDIVARDGSELVFIEVKTRSSASFGLPSEAVNPAKMARLRALALRWLAAHRDTLPSDCGLRFDVVSVVRTYGRGGPDVTHLRGAF